MKIRAEVKKVMNENKVRAIADIYLDNAFIVKNLRVIDGREKLFVSMPSVQNSDGKYKDICFPLTRELRKDIEEKVIQKYHEAVIEES